MNRVFLLSFLMWSSIACAAAVAADKGVESTIKQRIEEKFPGAKISSVRQAPWLGLYEVVTNEEVAYTDRDAKFLFTGRVVDIDTRQDLTKRRMNELLAVDFAKLPFDSAIKSVKGNGARKVVVFADPLCPYCVQLEQQLRSIDNVTVYTFLYPLETIHPGATDRAKTIWCADDRSSAWSSWMLSRTAPAANKACKEEPTTQLIELGKELKINATPTLFFADGHRVTGALSGDELEREFSAAMQRETKAIGKNH